MVRYKTVVVLQVECVGSSTSIVPKCFTICRRGVLQGLPAVIAAALSHSTTCKRLIQTRACPSASCAGHEGMLEGMRRGAGACATAHGAAGMWESA